MKASQRTGVLGAAIAALLLLVGADQLGLLPRAGSDAERTPSAGAAQDYLDAAARAAEHQALLDAQPRWNDALHRARAHWAEVRTGVVPGATLELAEARFRDLVLEATRDLRIGAVRASADRSTSSSLPAPAITPASGTTSTAPASTTGVAIRALALRIECDAPDPRDVYRLIDRLENLPDLRTWVSAVRLAGPGRAQTPQQVTLVLTLHAAAAVGEGS